MSLCSAFRVSSLVWSGVALSDVVHACRPEWPESSALRAVARDMVSRLSVNPCFRPGVVLSNVVFAGSICSVRG